MHRFLGRHPDIYMSPRKEPTFFGSDLSARGFVRDEREYLRLFEGATCEKVVGEASPWYLFSRRAAYEIRQFEPAARILILLRNPVDVMYAAHGQQVYNLNEPLACFRAALAAERTRKALLGSPSDSSYLPEGLLYREVVHFSEQVARYFDAFSRSQVLVVRFDEVVSTPEPTLRRVLRFLDVDSQHARTSFPVANARKRLRSPWLQRQLNNPPPGLASTLRQLLSRRLRRGLAGLLRWLNTRAGRPPLETPTRHELLREFSAEIDRLASLTGIDLGDWGHESMHRPSTGSAGRGTGSV